LPLAAYSKRVYKTPMEEGPPFEVVTKLEAADRQLRLAIRLFFERKDLIGVHALVAAALEIFRQVGRPRGLKSFYEWVNERVRPEKRSEVLKLFREAQNFFKHSGKDARKELKFYYTYTPLYIFNAAHLAYKLTGTRSPESNVFMTWFIFKNPGVLLDDEEARQVEGALAGAVDPDNFEAFLFLIDHYPKPKEAGL
jgi:hypothetical protein